LRVRCESGPLSCNNPTKAGAYSQSVMGRKAPYSGGAYACFSVLGMRQIAAHPGAAKARSDFYVQYP
jgi:hypothetical protein